MKKLVYLLILSLCLNGLAGAAFPWMSARAKTKTEAGAQKQASGKADKAEAEKKTEKKTKKTKVEKEYPLDLDGNNQVTLSQIIEYGKLKIRLKDVKSIELDEKKSKKLIAWEPDGENEGDYIFTVLKDFKEVRLHISTKKVSRLVVLLNGVKAGRDQPEAGEEAIPAEPAQPAEPVEAEPEAQAEALDADVPAPQEGPASEPVEGQDPAAEAVEAPEVESAAEIAVASLESIEAPEGAGAEEQTEVETEVTVELAQEIHAEAQADEPAQEPPVTEAAAEPTAPETGDVPQEAAPGNPDTPAQSEGDVTGDESVGTETPVVVEEQAEAPQPPAEAPEGQAEAPEAPAEAPESQAETPQAPAEAPEEQAEAPQAPAEAPVETPEGQTHETPRRGTGTVIPVDAEAWFKRGADLTWGTLREVIDALAGGETVYIQTRNLIFLQGAPLQMLSTVTLVPDGDVFKGDYAVCVSRENPAIVAEPALLQPAELPALGELADLYVWVAERSAQDPGDADKPALTVEVTGLAESGWSTEQPRFTLSGIPDGKDWAYAAIIYDERIVPIKENAYVPEAEGIYTLRFAMLDELGDIQSASKQYALQLDWTPPEVSIEEDEETSFTLNIDASDNISGVDRVSVDGGKTWHKMNGGTYTVTEKQETTFKAGAIRVSDVAGNVFKSEEDFTVSAVEAEDEGEEGGGGGGGGSGDNKPKLPHSSGDGDEGAEYDALKLELPDEPMEQLTVGGETMPLTLLLASAQEPSAFVGTNRLFTASLKHWRDASTGDAPNTLVLEAELDDGLGDAFTYEWRFNGEVYRLLANSGIRYVALKVDDAVVAFPTEGFTGGTRYTELKMQGISTRRFDYTMAMRLNLDPSHVSAMSESDYSEDCDLSIHVDVEGKNYELSNSPQSMMYFYNVFVGPEDMMDQPFGEYDAAA